jgi:hypothetical protein
LISLELKMLVVDGKEIEECKYVNLPSRNIRECTVKSYIIVVLELDDNCLTSFEAKDLPNLQVLDVSFNCLTSFEAKDLPNLQVLDLSENKLTSFTLGDLPNLRILDVSFNCLTSFETKDIPNLRNLDVSFNSSFSVLRLTLSQVPELQILNLERTNVKFIDSSLVHLVKGSVPRAHFFGTVELLEEAFVTKGHPVFEEIQEHIEI